MRSILYYISGHGFGHARRSAAVIAALIGRDDRLRVQVRTSAAPGILCDLLGRRVTYRPAELDPGAVEDDALSVNPQKTALRVSQVLAESQRLVEAELADAPADVGLVLADATFLAGDVAQRLGVPCLAVTNFTWDWIYEPWLAGQAGGDQLLARIRASYGKMAALLHMPFGGHARFREVMELPLVINRPGLGPEQVRGRLGIAEADGRPLVLIGQRGGIAAEVLRRAVGQSPHIRFVTTHDLPDEAPANLQRVHLDSGVSFAELLPACDAIISKLGYGTVADSIAANVAMLWPARVGFREDPLIAEEAAPFLRQRQIHLDRFRGGDWGEDLDALLAQPAPGQRMPTDGDQVAAGIIGQWL
jgi:hypothetical protein